MGIPGICCPCLDVGVCGNICPPLTLTEHTVAKTTPNIATRSILISSPITARRRYLYLAALLELHLTNS